MRCRIATLIGLVSAAVVSLAPVGSASTGQQSTVPFTGDQVVPGPGDPDGAGGLFFTLGKKTGIFCFFADTANISSPLTSVHLHRGARGTVGETVVELYGPSNDPDVSGCDNLGSELIKDISMNPGNYYVDIHNAEFPGGAVRAQLG
jgi:hypothetical protein